MHHYDHEQRGRGGSSPTMVLDDNDVYFGSPRPAFDAEPEQQLLQAPRTRSAPGTTSSVVQRQPGVVNLRKDMHLRPGSPEKLVSPNKSSRQGTPQKKRPGNLDEDCMLSPALNSDSKMGLKKSTNKSRSKGLL